MSAITRPGCDASTTTRDAEVDRLGDVVGHEQHRVLGPLPDREEEVLHRAPGLRVERAERLVEQQDVGLGRERAGDRDALAHAARELVGRVVGELGEPDDAEQLLHPLARWALRMPTHSSPNATFSRDRAPRVEAVGLEHHAAVGPGTDDRLVVDLDRARGRHVEPGDDVEQRRLPAAGRPDQAHELPVGDLEVHVVDREHRVLCGTPSPASVTSSFTTPRAMHDVPVGASRRSTTRRSRPGPRRHPVAQPAEEQVARDPDDREHDEDAKIWSTCRNRCDAR